MNPFRIHPRTRTCATRCILLGAAGAWLCLQPELTAQNLAIDASGYSRTCEVDVAIAGERIKIAWPMPQGEMGHVTLNFAANRALIESMAIATNLTAPPETLLQNIEPAVVLTAGTREAPAGRPPDMSVWNVFFDKPARRPWRTHLGQFTPKRARVTSEGKRATVSVDEVVIGPFRGEWRFTFYAQSRLVQAEAVVSTEEDRRAILYDAGLIAASGNSKNQTQPSSQPSPGWKQIAWLDTEGQWRRVAVENDVPDRPQAVRHRAIIAETAQGAIACFPPPHQFQFPRDWTDNLKFTWFGTGHAGAGGFGFGVQQVPDGQRAFEPWFNAPPGTPQHLGVFFLLSRGTAEEALRETLRYTHGDRFPRLPGHITFTSHYHMAVAMDALARQFTGVPDFVGVFENMGVDAVHIADFHGDGHPKDPGPLRLSEVEAMNKECRRLSRTDFLLIPGEEINEFLGLPEPGRHPGHWMSFFPKPVYWIERRGAGEPFREAHPRFGAVYRVGGREDMMELLRREHGLAWTAHPRIKASSWTPDIFRQEDFYRAEFWLGAAWKAMPADLSRERLGERALNLLDDMANWGEHKYMPGEVDVFKIDHTHELYGHMNINYLRLDRLPRFDEGWEPVLDALRRGRFFVTTGEVLVREFTLGGRGSGETLNVASTEMPELRVNLEWTFPLRFAEIISGDGQQVYRERIDLAGTTAFGRRTLTWKPRLHARKWARFEVWDVAANGAFTQPVWIEEK